MRENKRPDKIKDEEFWVDFDAAGNLQGIGSRIVTVGRVKTRNASLNIEQEITSQSGRRDNPQPIDKASYEQLAERPHLVKLVELQGGRLKVKDSQGKLVDLPVVDQKAKKPND